MNISIGSAFFESRRLVGRGLGREEEAHPCRPRHLLGADRRYAGLPERLDIFLSGGKKETHGHASVEPRVLR